MSKKRLFEKKKIPEFHPRAQLYLVNYLSQGLRVYGYMAIPTGQGPFPTVVYCRGGLRNIGMTKLAWIQQIVEEGFLVFAPFYRGNRGGQGREDFAGEDRYDVIDALPQLYQEPMVDEKRVHLFGFSRGALMALFAAMDVSGLRSVTVWGGVADVALSYEERVDLRRMYRRVIGGPPHKKPDAYRSRSPIYQVGKLQIPVQIIHGVRDEQVGLQHAFLLARSLLQANKPYFLNLYPHFGHHFPAQARKEAFQDMLAWMNRQERAKKEER